MKENAPRGKGERRSGFQREVRSDMRTQAEIDAERADEARRAPRYSYAALIAVVEASIGLWKRASDREGDFTAKGQFQQFAHGAVEVWGRLTK